MKLTKHAFAALGAVALGTTPALAQADAKTPATPQSATAQGAMKAQQGKNDPIDVRRWDLTGLKGGHSGERLLGTEVRGEDAKQLGEVANFLVNKQGNITGIIVESQGFMEVGDTHFFVPWKQVKLGANLDHVTVPVKEATLPNFSLLNDDESIYKPGVTYRGNELLNEFVRLQGEVPYGYVDDVVFNDAGRIQALIVSPDRRYGYGVYAYPYFGYYSPSLGYYDMPYGRNDIEGLKPFDYSALGIMPERQTSEMKSAANTMR